MVPRGEFLNCIIRGLPQNAIVEDVEDHIRNETRCTPFVSPIVLDPQTGTSLATVTLELHDEKRDVVVRRLNNSTFLGLPSRIHLDTDFYGLNVLADVDGSNIDFCFVHGLGGHAFQSWAANSQQPDQPPRMWPRDFLPARFHHEGIKARILTYGHRANTVVNADPQATISTAAEQLLVNFMADREKHPNRPIYFVCHSLGGLIICQALISCLSTDQGFTIKQQYKNLFMHNGVCMVKGIVFLGTPFRGSGQANFIYPFVKLLSMQYFWPINQNLVRSLKQRPIALGQIVGRFNRVRKNNLIQIFPCYETDAVAGTSLTTNRESAISAFDRDVAPLAINANHVQMIKYSHSQESSYRTMEDRIIQMVKSISYESVGGSNPPADDFGGGRVPRPSSPPVARPPSYGGGHNGSNTSSHGHGGSFGYSHGPAPQSRDIPLPTRPRQGPSTHPQRLPPLVQRTSTFGSQFTSPGLTRTGTAPPSYTPMAAPDIGSIDESKFESLKIYDTVFIIDDTGSMQKPVLSYNPQNIAVPERWAALVVALEVFAKIAAKYDDNGIDIAFLKNVQLNPQAQGLKNVDDVTALLSQINLADPICGGGTVVKDQLVAAIEPRMSAVREFAERRKKNPYLTPPKPLNLVVVTDGEADDEQAVEEYIVSVARELAELRAPKSYIGIQFVQIGDDVEAAEYLRRLDDGLKPSHQTAEGKPIRDMKLIFDGQIVDTTPFRGSFVEGSDGGVLRADEHQNFPKIMMGAIERTLDKLSNDVGDPGYDEDEDSE
ncbi:uncharacterized protein BDR25DRAFT_340886 [Lindgomyces ingoldianus]|uniref:Uncharacterized protein n=1 Tax=Lindgomyces ingoldianus TaxID=673940 RepID=A0ACB6R5G5_9PLEO|nr:uncharacterized protein BDR25DRAFT_340886 [Lindgomyces ingoldianus]KAF2474401.1 hypothetical protein BDR25DRAFT_340886 [Lindgomyces ingoldianus]